MVDASEARQQLDDCMRVYRRLTQREHEFIYGLSVRIALMGITPDESETLAGIWQRVSAGG